MNLLIFKTNIKSHQNVLEVGALFKNIPAISDWHVDIEDIDKVLRIEAGNSLVEKDVMDLVQAYGFQCEILPD